MDKEGEVQKWVVSNSRRQDANICQERAEFDLGKLETDKFERVGLIPFVNCLSLTAISPKQISIDV